MQEKIVKLRAGVLELKMEMESRRLELLKAEHHRRPSQEFLAYSVLTQTLDLAEVCLDKAERLAHDLEVERLAKEMSDAEPSWSTTYRKW